MKQITLCAQDLPKLITLGRHGDDQVIEYVFDCSSLVDEYGSGRAELLHMNANGTLYPCLCSMDGNFLHWVIRRSDLQCVGTGKLELRWFVGDSVKLLQFIKTLVQPSLVDCPVSDAEDPQEAWVDLVFRAGSDAKEAAGNAMSFSFAAANSKAEAESFAEKAFSFSVAAEHAAQNAPCISDRGTWLVYDPVSDQYVDTDIRAVGIPGEKGEKGDAGPQGVKGDIGPQGEKGDAGPQGEKGDAGPQGVKGDTGPQGERGEQGVSGVFVGSGDPPDGFNVQIDPAGEGVDVQGEISQLKESLLGLNNSISDKLDKPVIKSDMDDVAVAGAQYYLGQQSEVSVVLPDNAEVGQIISISWYNGETAATLSITGTMLDFDYTPSANTRSEINALWDGTYWAVLGNEMAVVADA